MVDINDRSNYIYVLKLIGQMKGYTLKLVIGTLVHLLHKIAPLALSFFISLLLSCVVTGRQEMTAVLVWTLVALVIGNAVLHYLDVLVSHDMAYRILADMRNMLYKKIDEIAPAATEDKQSGDILSIVLEDVELLEWFFAHTLNQLAVAAVVPLISLIVLGCFHWSIPLILVLFIFLLIIIPIKNNKRSTEQGAAVRENLGALNANVVDGVQGLKDIISFRWTAYYFKKVFSSTKKYNDSSLQYQKRAAGEGRAIQLIIGVGSLVSTVFIIRLAMSGAVGIEWILPLLTLTSLIFSPVVDALNMSTNYGSIFAAARRVFEIMQIEPYVKESTFSDMEILESAENACVRMDNVHFRYPTKNRDSMNPQVFVGLDLSFRSGESVVLVGASGCGKSTVARLLQRFWEPDSGSITICGKNIRDIPVEELREFVTLVPQDIYLFNMSIMDNLLLAAPNADKQDIINACRAAQADGFISGLSDGYDTVVGERGVRLSGGEKQRLAIAQAFLKDSPVLILDEASANLDSENERLLNEAIGRLKEGRATLIIAHRLSTIKNADRIVVINNGKTEAEGTFDNLIRSSEFFKTLIGEMNV